MIDNIPMCNVFLMNIFIAPEIETMFFWARQMFQTTEQKLNEQSVEIVKIREKQTVQMVEAKKK